VEVQGGGRIVISPVIIDADGTIYLQTIEHLPGLSAVFTDHCKYYLYAINPDGSLKWRREQGARAREEALQDKTRHTFLFSNYQGLFFQLQH